MNGAADNDGSFAKTFGGDVHAKLVILDAMLPNRNGIETMRELRCDTQFEATPVIMLTSVADSKAVRLVLRSVASDNIRKDASVEESKERLLLYLG